MYSFWYIFLFFNQIGHYWMPWRLCSKNSDQLPVLNRLTDIFAVGKFEYGVMVWYQNLTRKPELFQAPGTMYPLSPPLVGPGARYVVRKFLMYRTAIFVCQLVSYGYLTRFTVLYYCVALVSDYISEISLQYTKYSIILLLVVHLLSLA